METKNNLSVDELNKMLTQIVSKGYSLSTNTNHQVDNIIELNLNNHVNHCISKYNQFNLDVDKKDIKECSIYKQIEIPENELSEHIKQLYKEKNKKPYKKVRKDFNEIESDVKNYFNQFNKSDRINQLIEKHLRFDFTFNSNLKGELKERAKGKNVVTLHKNKFIHKVTVEKCRYMEDEWNVSSVYRLNEIEEYIFLTTGKKVDLSDVLKYSMKSEDFKKYDKGIFTIQVFKNGKVVIKSDEEDFIEKMNEPVREYYKNKDEFVYLND